MNYPLPSASVHPRPGAAPASRIVYVILGMHRSGTSLCSSVLNMLGIDMAEDEGIGGGNEAGHWERWPLMNLHDEILSFFDRGYYGPSHDFPLPVGWWANPNLRPFLDRIKSYISGIAEQNGLFGFKDPRTTKLLPVWKRIFADLGYTPKYIICLRNPGHVALSLFKRDKLPMEIGETRCLDYLVDALRFTEGQDRHFVRYDDWFEDLEGTLSGLTAFLGVRGHQDDRETYEAVAALIRPDLNHAGASAHVGQPLVRYFFGLVDQFAKADGADDASGAEIARFLESYRAFRQLLVPFEVQQRGERDARAAAEHRLAERDGALAQLQSYVSPDSVEPRRPDGLEGALTGGDPKMAGLAAAIAQLQASSAQSRALAAEAEAAAAGEAQRRVELEGSLAEAMARHSALESELARADEDRNHLAGRAEALEDQLQDAVAQYQARVAEAEAAAADHALRCAELEGDLARNGQERSDLAGSVGALQKELTLLRRQSRSDVRSLGERYDGRIGWHRQRQAASAVSPTSFRDMRKAASRLLEILRLREWWFGERAAAALRISAARLAPIEPPASIDGGPTAQLLASGLFDETFYRKQVEGEISGAAIEHYLQEGMRAGLKPHPLIDPARLTDDGSPAGFDVIRYLADPVLHARSPHPLFDAAFYLVRNGDVAAAGENPLAHYLRYGWIEGRSPNPLFDDHWYLASQPDLLDAGLAPLAHYAHHGRNEGRWPHALFDPNYYLARHQDVAAAGSDPLEHYLRDGLNEGRIPSQALAGLLDGVTGSEASALMKIAFGIVPAPVKLPPAGKDGALWPPESGDYWLPQGLGEYLSDTRDGDVMELIKYLCSIVDRYGDDPAGFDESDAKTVLIKRAQCLSGNAVSQPDVSIIIPVYNNLVFTLTCIVSILETDSALSCEIIVADDCSTDDTAAAIGAIGGVVRHVRHAENLGFLRNCNAATEGAGGTHLVFLNNDTLVMPGWLDRLIEPFTSLANVGLVGSKLLNADGTLQEAGGIFWSDGSAWNFGRNQNPRLPEFNYLKDVDYCSGASIAIPTRLWRSLGGFDSVFSPAYCEDSDLAFRVREVGARTLYQPGSELIHHEGRSHGRDVQSGVKAYQVVNQKTLFDRWQRVLSRENFTNGQNVPFARDRSGGRPHLLLIDHYVPQWDRDAGSRTIYNYIRTFVACGFHVIFWPDNLYRDPDYTPLLQAMGVEVIYGAEFQDFPTWLAKNAQYLNYVLLSRPDVANKYIDAIDAFPHLKTIYYGHDLHFLRIQNQMAAKGETPEQIREAVYWERLERSICRRCNVVMYPGIEEVEIVRDWVPRSTEVVRLPITLFSEEELEDGLIRARYGVKHDPYHMMFVGGFTHTPNLDGILWFVKEVMPHLARHDSRFRLSVAGSNAPEQVKALAGACVKILGRVSDEELRRLYEDAAIAVVPLRYGGGVKGKVIEAMAHGISLVMTGIGAQGIPDAGRLAFMADDAAQFAAEIILSVEDDQLARAKAEAAIGFLREYSSVDGARRLLSPVIPELALGETADGLDAITEGGAEAALPSTARH